MSFRRQYIHAIIRLLAGLAVGAWLAAPAVADDAGHPAAAAGTEIHNTAVVTYVVAGHGRTALARNTFAVDQLLDVTATWQDGSAVRAPAGASARSLRFRVTNTGNGSDSYDLKFQVSPDADHGFTAQGCHLFVDANHDGVWSDRDRPYPAPAQAPALDAGASMSVLAVCDIPGDAADQSLSHVKLSVASNTLTGEPGDAHPAAGRRGMVVVVGMSGNTASATGTYAATNVSYAFTSTQQVTDRSGGHVATSGSHVTYTLTVTPEGTATGRELVINTPVPDHTTYVPGSLELDGAHLGDSDTDGDAGQFDAASHAIGVRLGDVAGTSTARHIRFQVTIN